MAIFGSRSSDAAISRNIGSALNVADMNARRGAALALNPGYGINIPSSQEMTDTDRLEQLLQGNLAGQLSSGDKLSALGALLKSVSRGSTTTPQQVIQGLQQQKLQEVQGRLQIEELRKAAGRKAQRDALREDLLAKARNDEERAQIRILSDESLDKFALQRLEQKAPDMETKQRQLMTYYDILEKEGPDRASAYWRLVAPGQVVGSIETGLRVYNPPEPTTRTGGVAGDVTQITEPQPKPVEPTESERTAGFLTKRLQDALATIDRVGKSNPDALRPSAATEAIRGIFGEAAANTLASPERQQIEAAQRDALDAALTLGTGAAYTAEQLEGYRKSYFPQLGDSPSTVADKARRREVLFQSARIKAGRSDPARQSAPKSSVTKTFTIDGKQYTISPKG
jgi:hypothetical protein